MTWQQQERGWYTSETLGGIVQERGPCYWYPPEGEREGPFATLAEALTAAQRWWGNAEGAER